MRTTDPRLAALAAQIAATPARDQFAYHAKTTPKGEPCDVCGCTSALKGAAHRALTADETYQRGNRGMTYTVRRIVCFGADYTDTPVAC